MADLNEIVAFAGVVREGSFTRAAASLGLRKSTVSERIARLEHRLGVRLLERTTRTVRTTALGASYYERISRALGEVDEAETLATEGHKTPRGLVRMASPSLFAEAFLDDFVPEFLMHYPEVELELVVADRRVAIVDEGFDLAIHVVGPKDPNLASKRLGSATRVCVASPGYLNERGIPTTPVDIAHHAVVIAGGAGGLERRVDWEFSKDGKKVSVPVRARYSVSALRFTLGAAIRGVGIAIIPAFHCASAIADGSLVRILDGWTMDEREISVVYPKRRQPPARVRLLIDMMVERFTSLPTWPSTFGGRGRG